MYTKGRTMAYESLYIQFGEHLEKFLYIFTKKRFWQIIEAFARRFIQLSQLFPPKWKVSSIEKLLAMIRKIQFGLKNIFCGWCYQESWFKNTYPGIFQGFWINTTTIPTIRSWIYYSLSAHFMWTPATTSS